jgi:ribosomal protein L24E
MAERPKPKAPKRVDCHVCRKHIPPTAGYSENKEYAFYFCSPECFKEYEARNKKPRPDAR